jgi:hypothetical protein
MSFLFDVIETEKPDSADTWLTKELKVDFESTYFKDEECAIDILIEMVSQNGLDKEFDEKSNLDLDILPFKLEQTDYNPMIEAMANWNEYISNN